MKAIRAAVLTRDDDYGIALCRAIARNRKSLIVSHLKPPFEAEVEKFDFIVTDFDEAEFFCENALGLLCKSGEKKASVIFLKENVSLGDSSRLSLEELISQGRALHRYKYGSVKELADLMIAAYCLKHGTLAEADLHDKCQIIAVTSDKGGCGKTVFSLALAQELRRFRGKKVLYISFSPFEITDSYVACDEERKRNFQELLYYFFKGRPFAMEGVVLQDAYGVELLPPAPGKNPLSTLTEAELGHFFEHICGMGRYDVVICDMAGSFSETELGVLGMSRVICLLTASERLKSYLELVLGEEAGEKLTEVSVCRDAENVILKDGQLRISIDADFGRDVKEFAENSVY